MPSLLNSRLERSQRPSPFPLLSRTARFSWQARLQHHHLLRLCRRMPLQLQLPQPQVPKPPRHQSRLLQQSRRRAQRPWLPRCPMLRQRLLRRQRPRCLVRQRLRRLAWQRPRPHRGLRRLLCLPQSIQLRPKSKRPPAPRRTLWRVFLLIRAQQLRNKYSEATFRGPSRRHLRPLSLVVRVCPVCLSDFPPTRALSIPGPLCMKEISMQ